MLRKTVLRKNQPTYSTQMVLSKLSVPSSDLYEAVPSPVFLRKHHTVPDIQSPENDAPRLEKHNSQPDSNFATRGQLGLTIAEKIAVLTLNKHNKDVDRLLLWACLCELVLNEQISTCKLDGENIFALYVYNKKPTGNEIADSVLSLLVKQSSGKRMADIMKEVESTLGKKVLARVSSTLVQKGIFKLKKKPLWQTYKLVDNELELKIKSEINAVLHAIARSDLNGTADLDPFMYALIALLACNGATLSRDVLESQDVLLQQAAIGMIGKHSQWQRGIVSAMIFERLYHIVCEYQKQ
jgi:hypothetical protein